MNNAFINADSPPEPQFEAIKDRESKLVRTIQAIKAVSESREYSSLKTELFDPEVESLRKQIFAEAKKLPADPIVLAHLNGKYEMAKKYHDLTLYAKERQTELNNLRVKYGRKTTQNTESTGQYDL